MSNFNYTPYVQILTNYALNEGFKEVTIDKKVSSQIFWKKRLPSRILVEKKDNIELTVYLFLHELGHNELRKDWELFKSKLPTIAINEELLLNKKKNRSSRSKTYHTECLEEEYLAWSNALLLAKKLDIPVDLCSFNKLKSKCLMAYIQYYGGMH